MEPVSSRCAEILLYLKISIRWGSVLLWCASLIRCRKYKVHEVGFVTAATGPLHLHYDSKSTHTNTRTHKGSSPFHLPKPFRVTTALHLMLLQCSVSGVAIEFVPLRRIWNLKSTGLCWAAVICTTATITLCVILSKWNWLTVITMPNVAAVFMLCFYLILTLVFHFLFPVWHRLCYYHTWQKRNHKIKLKSWNLI